jgi:hypothetical protein
MDLYGLLITHPEQEPLINKHCFGDCGKISMGGGIITDFGALFVCTHKDCPYEKGVTDEPMGWSEMTGEPVFVRALHDIPSPQPSNNVDAIV